MTVLTKKRPKKKFSEILWKVSETSDKESTVTESEVTTGFSTNGREKGISLKPIQAVTLPPGEDDPFYYGWRYDRIEQPDGTTLVNKIPLPLERFLNPQMGDFFVQSDPHYTLTDSVHDSYDNRYDDDESIGVFSDLKMVWGIPGLEEPAPDIAIIPNLKEPEKKRSIFNVPEEGTRPCLIIEVASPRYPVEDDKIAIYEQAGVQEYIIIDAHWGNDKKELEFKGYKMVNGRYQPMVKDAQGRLYSDTTDTYLFFETGKGGKVISYITDGTTGERMLDNRGSHRARLIEAIGRRSAEQLARQEAKRADENAANLELAEKQARTATEKAVMEAIEREAAEERAEAEATERRMAEERAEMAEQQVQAEAAERRMAEERAEAEAAAKLAAKERAETETAAKLAAEERAEAEVAERLAAEERMKEALAKIAELEAQLAQEQTK